MTQTQTAAQLKNDYKNAIIIKIPFIGHESILLKRRLLKAFKRLHAASRLHVVFFTHKLKNMFPLKARTPKSLKANVVYEFTCENDSRVSYIRKTRRHLGIRMKEHCSTTTAIFDHRLQCSCTCDTEGFSTLASASNDFDLRIKEAILIKRKQPSLNTQLASHGSEFLLTLL